MEDKIEKLTETLCEHIEAKTKISLSANNEIAELTKALAMLVTARAQLLD